MRNIHDGNVIPCKNYYAHHCCIQNMDARYLGPDLVWQYLIISTPTDNTWKGRITTSKKWQHQRANKLHNSIQLQLTSVNNDNQIFKIRNLWKDLYEECSRNANMSHVPLYCLAKQLSHPGNIWNQNIDM